MQDFLKKLIILTSIFFSIQSFAEENLDKVNKGIWTKDAYHPGYPVTKRNLMQAYNTPARVKVHEGYDFFVEGSFLWWQPKEKGLIIGVSSSIDLEDNPIKIFHLETDYHPGFQIGCGFHHNLDDWTILARYTWFKKNTKNSIEKDLDFTSPWFNATTMRANAKWDLDTNFFELLLSRTSLTGKKVIFSPIFGFIGGWLDQKYDIISETEKMNSFSDSWLIGPKAEINSSWILKYNLRILANISASLFYQRYSKISYELITISTSNFLERISSSKHYLTPNLNIYVGLSYGVYLNKNTWHLNFLLKYGFIHFWNQNQIGHLLHQIGLIRFDAESLMMHGLTASIRWDF